MNAEGKGREHGFAERLRYIQITKEQFQQLGEQAAKQIYSIPEKQTAYLAGWMENWKEPHPHDCTCDVCDIRAIIDWD